MAQLLGCLNYIYLAKLSSVCLDGPRLGLAASVRIFFVRAFHDFQICFFLFVCVQLRHIFGRHFKHDLLFIICGSFLLLFFFLKRLHQLMVVRLSFDFNLFRDVVLRVSLSIFRSLLNLLVRLPNTAVTLPNPILGNQFRLAFE